MDIYKYINKHIVYPLYYSRHGNKRLTHLADIEKNQYLEQSKLDDLRLEKAKSIIQYAYEHTRFYKKRLDDIGLNPADIQSLSDIEKIPPLTKQDIQNHREDLISDEYNVDELMKDASGGSTGEPTIFYRDMIAHQLRPADQTRHDRWSGWDIGDRFALIWGAQRDLKATQNMREHIISRYIARIWELDAFELTEENMQEYVNTLEAIKPGMVLGYANALVAFSEFLLKKFPDHKIRPKGIVSSAETLTEEKRSIIEKAFHCKVLNRYGSREVGLIASECKAQEGLHINADNLLVEVTNNGQPIPVGQAGDILVTDFMNKGMPLIRYKLGDIGIMSDRPCSCGRTLPLLKSVEGRSGDFFVAENGSLVHGEYFTHLFYGIDNVKQFQMIQDDMENITLKLVTKSPNEDDDYLSMVETKTKEMLGQNINISVIFVDDIPPTASGKRLFTISKVKR